jgi:hypothetical protein
LYYIILSIRHRNPITIKGITSRDLKESRIICITDKNSTKNIKILYDINKNECTFDDDKKIVAMLDINDYKNMKILYNNASYLMDSKNILMIFDKDVSHLSFSFKDKTLIKKIKNKKILYFDDLEFENPYDENTKLIAENDDYYSTLVVNFFDKNNKLLHMASLKDVKGIDILVMT